MNGNEKFCLSSNCEIPAHDRTENISMSLDDQAEAKLLDHLNGKENFNSPSPFPTTTIPTANTRV